MKSILYNKRGELTTKQIVVMVVLIISFVIVLFFIFQLSPKETADKQICHDSVVLRGNSLLGGQTLPLKCKTSYVYVTASSTRSNEKMGKPERVVDVRTKDDVYEFLAEDMYDCWWMFGQGEVDYLGEVAEIVANSYCSICSQVVFDESVKKIFEDNGGKLDKDDFYNNYLTNKVPGKDFSYAEYFLGTNNPREFLGSNYEVQDEKGEGEGKVSPKSWGDIDFDETQIIIMAISSEVSKLAWAGIGALIAGGIIAAILLAPFTGGASLVSAVGIIAVVVGAGTGAAAAAIIVAPIVQGGSGKQFVPPTIMVSESSQYKALDCKEIKSLS